jgi:hypothetical protein
MNQSLMNQARSCAEHVITGQLTEPWIEPLLVDLSSFTSFRKSYHFQFTTIVLRACSLLVDRDPYHPRRRGEPTFPIWDKTPADTKSDDSLSMYVCFLRSKCARIDVSITVLFSSSNVCLQTSFHINDTSFRINLINDLTIFAKFLMNRL